MRAFPLIALLSLPAAAGDYLVLSSVGAKDPYYAAATTIAEFHKAGAPVAFDPAQPDAILPKLKELKPAHVAIVLRPEEIDINLARRFLRVASQVDADPFVDFDYGFITGATPKEAKAFVANIVRASAMERPRTIGKGVVWGGDGGCKIDDSPYRAGSVEFPCHVLGFVAPDGKHGRDQKFIDENMASLSGKGAVMFGGHGNPWEIGSGPRAEDVAKVSLFPAVVFNYACHTGVALKWHNEKYEADSIGHSIETIEPGRSFALSVIKAGATGYVAYVNPRPAGPELDIDFQRVLAGASLGESRRQDWAKITMGYLGFGEKAIAAPDVVDGSKTPRKGMDIVRDMMLDGAAGGVLYGDPAIRPFPGASASLPQSTEAKREGGVIRVTMKVEYAQSFVWCSDPFRMDGKEMAMKVYDRIEVPKDFGDVAAATVESATWGKTALKTMPVLVAAEEDQGKRYLHVKVNFSRVENPGGDVMVVVCLKSKKR
ncbi:MAG: hypothetical protein FD180_1977 [Planctomycetota bacterium]|nr:MAG: hypothetical protein FD180_1977 [Planctomycetota bacterium]